MPLQHAWEWLMGRTTAQALLLGLALAALIEAITCFLRFGLGLTAAENTSWMAGLTFGYRIHHGFYGVILLAASALVPKGGIRNLLVVAGTGLLVSDAFHHGLLRLLHGSAEFDLRYPET